MKNKTKKLKKKKRGRPSKKDGLNLELIEKLTGLGLIDVEIAYVIGVDEVTINNWKKDPKFLLALKKGKVVADARVIDSLYKRALGYSYDEVTFEKTGRLSMVTTAEIEDIKAEPEYKKKIVTKEVVPDVTAQIFWLKNRRPEDWRDVTEKKVTFKTEDKKKEELTRLETLLGINKRSRDIAGAENSN